MRFDLLPWDILVWISIILRMLGKEEKVSDLLFAIGAIGFIVAEIVHYCL